MRISRWKFYISALLTAVFIYQCLLIYTSTLPRKAEEPVIKTRADGSKLNPLDVVLITDTSGLSKTIGTDTSKGFQDAINASAITDYVRLVARDDKGKVEATAALADGSASGFQTLAIIGPTAPEGYNAVRQAANEGGVVSISPIGNPTDKPNGAFTFSMQSDTKLRGQMLGRFLQRIEPKTNITRLVPESSAPDGLWAGVLQSYKDVSGQQLDITPWKLEMSPDALKEAVSQNMAYDAIVVSLPMKNAIDAVRQFKLFGYTGKIILEGDSSLEEFSRNFQSEPREKIQPGYFSDDLLSLVPFTTAIGNAESQKYITDFRQKFNSEPSWAYAYGYDAGLLISNFIKTELQKGTLDLKNPDAMRAGLQKFLKSTNDSDQIINGFTGSLKFDTAGRRSLPPSAVIFNKRKHLPYYIQFSTEPGLSINHTNDQNFISIGEIGYGLIPVVYTGFQIISVNDVDFDKGQFTTTFDIWLKSKDPVDVSELEFIGLVGDLKSKQLVEETSTKTSIFRRYRVTGQFNFTPRPADVLLDRTNIVLSFRHKSLSQENLKFVIDPDFNEINNRQEQHIRQRINLSAFDVVSSFMSTDKQIVSAPGDPRSVSGFISFSQSSYQAQIGRRNSSMTSYLASRLGNDNLYFSFYMATSILVSLLIASLAIKSRKLSILFQIAIAGTAFLSETALFISPIIDNISPDFLPGMRIVYAAFEIFSIVRVFDIGLIGAMESQIDEQRVQPVILFIIRFALYFMGIAYFYTVTINKDIVAVLATFSVALTVVGLALRELIFDAIAGVAMAGDRHLEVGQWVNLRTRDRSISGVVQGLGWRFVRIKSRDEQTHFVPNSAVVTQILSNLSLSDGFTRVEIPFEMSALSDFSAISPRILQTVNAHIANFDGVDQRRESKVLLTSLENETLLCSIQIYFSSDRSIDRLKTTVLDAIRIVLTENNAFSHIEFGRMATASL